MVHHNYFIVTAGRRTSRAASKANYPFKIVSAWTTISHYIFVQFIYKKKSQHRLHWKGTFSHQWHTWFLSAISDHALKIIPCAWHLMNYVICLVCHYTSGYRQFCNTCEQHLFLRRPTEVYLTVNYGYTWPFEGYVQSK